MCYGTCKIRGSQGQLFFSLNFRMNHISARSMFAILRERDM